MKGLGTCGVVAGCAIALVLTAACEKPAASKMDGPKVEATIQEIMVSIVAPTAQKTWDATVTMIDDQGTRELHPKTDAEWQEVRAAALTLLEAPNLLAMEGRALSRPGAKLADEGGAGMASQEEIAKALVEHRADFLKHARDLQVQTALMVAAIDKRDIEQMQEIGGEMDEVCEACHAQFWYPRQGKKPAF